MKPLVIKKILLTILLVIWLGIIFMFSNSNGYESQNTSDKVASTVISTINVNSKDNNKTIKNTRFLVRKLAHFILFFILGIIIYSLLSCYNLNKVFLFSLLFCIFYACTDEIHQLFVVGRSCKIMDILIDSFASFIGINVRKCLHF